jgi:hypothetical protein
MRLIVSPRQGGKTSKMIEWLNGDPYRLLITFSVQEADRIAQTFNVERFRVLSFDEYMRGLSKGKIRMREVSIDNADMVMQSLFSEEIKNVTFTKNEKQK